MPPKTGYFPRPWLPQEPSRLLALLHLLCLDFQVIVARVAHFTEPGHEEVIAPMIGWRVLLDVGELNELRCGGRGQCDGHLVPSLQVSPFGCHGEPRDHAPRDHVPRISSCGLPAQRSYRGLPGEGSRGGMMRGFLFPLRRANPHGREAIGNNNTETVQNTRLRPGAPMNAAMQEQI